MILPQLLLIFVASRAQNIFNFADCSNNITGLTIPDRVTLRGRKWEFFTKSGQVLDGNGDPFLEFETKCMAWSPTDARVTQISTGKQVFRLDQDNVEFFGQRIRIRDCNDKEIGDLNEKWLSTWLTSAMMLEYDIDVGGVTVAKTENFRLFDRKMYIKTEGITYVDYDLPFGERIQAFFEGSMDATLQFTNTNVTLGRPGDDRMLTVAMAIYYLVLNSLGRDKDGNINSTMCSSVYRLFFIIPIAIGVCVLICCVIWLWVYCSNCRKEREGKYGVETI